MLARADLATTKLSHGTPRLWRDRGAELAGRVVVHSDQGALSLPSVPSAASFTPYLAKHIPRGPGGYALLDLPGLGPVYAQAAPVPPGWRMHVNEDPLYLKLLGHGKPPWICWSDLSHAQRLLMAETLTEQQRIAFRPERTRAKYLRTRMVQFNLDCLSWMMVDDEGRTVPVPLEEDLYPTPEAAMEAARQRWAYPGRQEGTKRRAGVRPRAVADRT
ncbi:hypothetical protein SCE1572_36320 [Sorangium cellulosum So0157-2]|uniref:Uncharacterized protein n=1 Tax=Sorangium cellulosum So0157-2 TaxID=1254432 RepID=S4Y1Y1_SORCE|nr:hypothetical protein SCE1572_36320 [Sorangium cellulosum So0157-2]